MSSVSKSDEAVLDDIKNETGVSYNPEDGSVEFSDVSSVTEQYVSLVEYLVSNEYITGSDLPVSAAQAQTRNLINSTPTHEDRDMLRQRKVRDGVYLETNHDSSSKARYAAKFIERFILDR
jgi:hypothetical protein